MQPCGSSTMRNCYLRYFAQVVVAQSAGLHRKGPVMRQRFRASLLGVLVSIGLAQHAVGQSPEFGGKALLKAVKLSGSSYEVRAGQIEVWENRKTKSGRKIPINVIVIPAKVSGLNKAP